MIKKSFRIIAIALLSITSIMSTTVIAAEEPGTNLLFSTTTSKLTLDAPSPIFNSAPSMSPTIVESDNVTIAEFGSSMNCSTGDIKVTGAIPEVSSFKDALKVLAPFAVGEDGEVDFKVFLKEILTEFAVEETTESMLEYLAYIHYYITASMGPDAPSSAKIFKTAEYASCVKKAWAGATETEIQTGGGEGSTFDDFGAQIGLDITALFKIKGCFKKSKGPIFSSQAEEERYQKSLKIVRAIFYKLLNAQMNFDLKGQSDYCKNYDKQVFEKTTSQSADRKFLLQNAHGGQRLSPDGSQTSMPLLVDTINIIKRADAEDSSLSAKRSADDTIVNETTNTTKSGSKAISMGSIETERKVDLEVRLVYKPAPYNIDITDLGPHERITLFNRTSKDFMASVVGSDFYDGMSSASKKYFEHLLTAATSTQSLNYKHLEDLSCAMDKNKCHLSSWLLEAEYQIVTEYNGFVNKCIKVKNIANRSVCVESKPNVTYNEGNSGFVTDKAKQQKYMQHIIRLELLELVESYYKSLGAFTFAEDFDDEQLAVFSSTEYVKNKISLLKRSKLLKQYWSSPIASLSQKAILNIIDSQKSNSILTTTDRAETYRLIKDIFDGRGGNQMSLTPYIYEPMNEFQMAKFLHLMSDPARINLLLAKTDKDGLGFAPKLPLSFDVNTSLNVFQVVQDNNYKSITSKIDYNGFSINPVINNSKRNDTYTSLSIDELNNLAILMEKFKDFYVKRLVDVINERFNLFKSNQMSELKNNSTTAAIYTLKNEMSVIDFKQQQKREMLKLLVN